MKDNNFSNSIFRISKETIEKLENTKVPPYPKYYHEVFVDLISKDKNEQLRDFAKKYSYLFYEDLHVDNIAECYNFAKKSLKGFEHFNSGIKVISDKSKVDIEDVKHDTKRIKRDELISMFSSFQNKIFDELKQADEAILKLKLEIDRLERESNIDPLTKMYNRKALMADIEDVLSHGKEKNLNFNLLIIDIDDFKHVNDNFGHIAGDKTLIYLSKLIQNSLRKGERVYRFGGEEFIIMFNRVSQKSALEISKRLLKDTRESKLFYQGKNINLTLSAGLTKHKKEDDAETIIERADSALYEAKSKGKNRVEIK